MLDEELSEMDRVTQLQDAIEQLLLMMAAAVDYVINKTNLLQVSQQIPVTKSRGAKADPPDVFLANQKELVDDLMRKAKQIETLINSLPAPDRMENQTDRLIQLEADMKLANAEYRQAVHRARSLHKEVSDVLQLLLMENEVPETAGQSASDLQIALTTTP